jgi:hypothetical protein
VGIITLAAFPAPTSLHTARLKPRCSLARRGALLKLNRGRSARKAFAAATGRLRPRNSPTRWGRQGLSGGTDRALPSFAVHRGSHRAARDSAPISRVITSSITCLEGILWPVVPSPLPSPNHRS